MPISSYPRVTVQGTGTAQNTQNGSALMVVNPSTGKYEAATAATFGGGGGGDATAANQTTQISLATTLNSNTTGLATASGQSTIQATLNNMLTELTAILNKLTDIKANQTNSTQITQISGGGNLASVNGSQELLVNTGA